MFGLRGLGGGGGGGRVSSGPSFGGSGRRTVRLPPSEFVPVWGPPGGFNAGGDAVVGERLIMEIDTESLSDRTTGMEDTFTILPNSKHRTPILVACSGQQPSAVDPAAPFGAVEVCDVLSERLADPRVFALTIRLRDVFLGNMPFELGLPHGAEPAALFACISAPEVHEPLEESTLSFNLSDVSSEGAVLYMEVEA